MACCWKKLLKTPGFIYQIKGNYYFLGKWICKECTDTDATDCVMMYQMLQGKDRKNQIPICIFKKYGLTAILLWRFLMIRIKIRSDMALILDTLSEEEIKSLTQQVENVESDVQKYCS